MRAALDAWQSGRPLGEEDQKFFDDHEELAKSVTRIVGQGSGAAAALRDLETKREAGLEVVTYTDQSKWVVLSRPALRA